MQHGIPASHYREKARSRLAARGLYPPQGMLHGLMYPTMFAAGLGMGVGLAGVSQWIVAALAIVAFICCFYVGSRRDNEYEGHVIEAALQLEHEAKSGMTHSELDSFVAGLAEPSDEERRTIAELGRQQR